MKKLTIALCSAIAFATSAFAQQTQTKNGTWTYSNYDYELWSENNAGTTSMTLNGTAANGGTFTATWQNTINILFRAGRKFSTTTGGTISGREPPKTALDYGNISIDFDATWSSNDNVKMLGVYGWAFYTSGSTPTKDENGQSKTFSKEIEYYIIQDRGNYNAATGGDTKSTLKGTGTIDGIEYEFRVCDRIGRNALSGSTVNFKQYFSVPKNTSSHRTKGIISVSEHFKAWEKAGMKMDGPLYEVALKVESYTGSGGNANGSATIRKNLLTIGGTSTTSSNSTGGTSSSSRASSSSMAAASTTCNDYQASFCGNIAWSSVTGGSTTAPTAGKCLYIGNFDIIQPSLNSTVAINGVENACGGDWDNCPYNNKPTAKDGGYYVYVKTGTINGSDGWQGIVARPKPTCSAPPTPSSSSRASSSSAAVSSSSRASSSSVAVSSSSRASSSSTAVSSSSSTTAGSSSSAIAGSSSSAGIETSSSSEDGDPSPILNSQFSTNSQFTYYTLKGEPLGNAKPQKAGVYIVKQGSSFKKIVVR